MGADERETATSASNLGKAEEAAQQSHGAPLGTSRTFEDAHAPHHHHHHHHNPSDAYRSHPSGTYNEHSAVFSLGRPLLTWEERQLLKQQSRSRHGSPSRPHTPVDSVAPSLDRHAHAAHSEPEVRYVLVTPEMLKELSNQGTSSAAASRSPIIPEKPAIKVEHIEESKRAPDSAETVQQSASSSNGIVKHGVVDAAAPAHGYLDEVLEKKKLSEEGDESSCSDSESDVDIFPNPWAKFRYMLREPFAEFIGTALLICFGNGVNNQVTLSANPGVAPSQKGQYLSISFGWGIGVMAGVYAAGGISGGHINPAVTFSLAIFRRFPWWKVPIYWLAQCLGGCFGAAIVYLNYVNAINIFEGGPNVRTIIGPTSTANLFTTFPADYMTRVSCFYNEFIDTAILLIVILAISDRNNTPPPDGTSPFVLLFLVLGLGACLGSQTAYAINPARDFGPRLLCWFVGYGRDLWTWNNAYWLWTPWIAPLTGGAFGSFVYDALIYTGGESPLNMKWSWKGARSRLGWGPATKKKVPAGTDKV